MSTPSSWTETETPSAPEPGPGAGEKVAEAPSWEGPVGQLSPGHRDEVGAPWEGIGAPEG